MVLAIYSVVGCDTHTWMMIGRMYEGGKQKKRKRDIKHTNGIGGDRKVY